MPIAGRFGDEVDFTSLNTEFQTPAIADLVGATVSPGAEAFETCGSPGEIKNVPTHGHHFYAQGPVAGTFEINQLEYPLRSNSGKSILWANVAFSAADQLRQRVAWCLSQILVTGDSIGREAEMEPWAVRYTPLPHSAPCLLCGSARYRCVAPVFRTCDAMLCARSTTLIPHCALQVYYDIFVRNAFGSYRDILREVAYSPLMGDYLTYRQNRRYADRRNFPDENFAREIMQLFSIGLFQLNTDGSVKTDVGGNPIDT